MSSKKDTPSTSKAVEASRISFGGPVRLNDLLNDDENYGFAEEATEACFMDGGEEENEGGEEMRGDEGPSASFNSSSASCSIAPPTIIDAPEDSASISSPEEGACTGERASLGSHSCASNDSQKSDKESKEGKEKPKGIGALIDKAKNKLHVGKDKKEKNRSVTPELISEASQCLLVPTTSEESPPLRPPSALSVSTSHPSHYSLVALYTWVHLVVHHMAAMPFPSWRAYSGAILIAHTVFFPGMLAGFLWGLYLSLSIFLFFFVSEPRGGREQEELAEEEAETSVEDGDEAFECLPPPIVVYEYKGWMNALEYPARYNPSSYHVNSCKCVLVRLENNLLRISRPSRAVLKHAFHTDPTLTQAQPTMVGQAIYDLADATVSLRPRRLARRRWWSRKYPIYIRFAPIHSDQPGPSGMRRSVSMNPTGSSHETRSRTTSVADEDMRDYESEEDSECSEEELAFESAAPIGVTRTKSSVELSSSLPTEATANPPVQSKKKKAKSLGSSPRGIYLFARAAREKERWFHLLREAAAKTRLPSIAAPSIPNSVSVSSAASVTGSAKDAASTASSLPSSQSTPAEQRRKRNRSNTFEEEDMDEELSSKLPTLPSAREFMLYRTNHTNFARSMSEAIGIALASLAKTTMCTASSGDRSNLSRGLLVETETLSVDLGSVKWKAGAAPDASADLVHSINAIAARIFFDFCRDSYWCEQVKEKIQTKLATIHLPYFIENLELSSLELGTATPHIESVYAPKVDEWGLWVDFEMRYSGGIRLALETRVNLLKLQSGAVQVDTDRMATRETRRATRYSDEDCPESPEDSPDEDFGAKMNPKPTTTREKAGSKLISFVESAARTSIFQKAAKLPKVAKVITEISSTRLILNVEIESIEGTMTVNLPPPPSDRIWYAFRKPPRISIRAVPQVGDRSVDLTTVSDWIESRLRLLLEKNLVCPNMDDVCIPAMQGNELLNMGYNT